MTFKTLALALDAAAIATATPPAAAADATSVIKAHRLFDGVSGKAADRVAVPGNALKHVGATEQPSFEMARGVLFVPAK